jgi:hypothetical protein
MNDYSFLERLFGTTGKVMLGKFLSYHTLHVRYEICDIHKIFYEAYGKFVPGAVPIMLASCWNWS